MRFLPKRGRLIHLKNAKKFFKRKFSEKKQLHSDIDDCRNA